MHSGACSRRFCACKNLLSCLVLSLSLLSLPLPSHPSQTQRKPYAHLHIPLLQDGRIKHVAQSACDNGLDRCRTELKRIVKKRKECGPLCKEGVGLGRGRRLDRYAGGERTFAQSLRPAIARRSKHRRCRSPYTISQDPEDLITSHQRPST